jgi:hypothetical protein
MGFDHFAGWDPGLSFERVNVLSEAGVQFPVLMEQTNEDMRGGRYEPTRRDISSECVDCTDVEDGPLVWVE